MNIDLEQIFTKDVLSYNRDELLKWMEVNIGGFEVKNNNSSFFALGQDLKEFSDYLIYIKQFDIQKYLEIGTSIGGSLITSCFYLKNTLKFVHAIDPYRIEDHDFLKIKLDFIKNLGINTRYLSTISDIYFYTNKEKFDLVFIDGHHAYPFVKRDFENALKSITENGIVVLHDINSKNCSGPKKLWQEIKSSRCVEFVYGDNCGIGVYLGK